MYIYNTHIPYVTYLLGLSDCPQDFLTTAIVRQAHYKSDLVALGAMESKSAVEAIAFVNAYLRDQALILKASSFKVVQAGQIRSLLKRLATCASISEAEASAVVQEVNNGNWDENHQEMLGTAIDKLVSVGQAAASQSITRKVQKCDAIENYLTDTDFSKILDTHLSRPKRYEACCEILTRIKMPCPDPRVKRRLVAIMSSADEWMQNPVNAKTTLDDLGTCIKGLRAPLPRAGAHEHVTCFDDDPADMEAQIPGYMESVYSGEAPSVEPPVTTDEIDAILAGRCLRATHKSVRGARNGNTPSMLGIMSPSMAMQPHGCPPTDMSMMMQPMVQMMQSVMQGCMQQMMGRMAGGGVNADDDNLLNIRYGAGNDAGGGHGGGNVASKELARLKRSRTDDFWKRRQEAEGQHAEADARNKRRSLLDSPSAEDADKAIRDTDDVPNADQSEEDKLPPKADHLSELEATMREHKAFAKATAKAKAVAKATAKATATAKAKAKCALPCKAVGKAAKPLPAKCAKRVAEEPKTPYKGPKLEPMLAHILCAARLNLSPSKGAFCTAGSNNASRALQLKGHNPDVQKAGGRHGWALAATYWENHRK
jgi:hypothetical protein